MGAEKFVAEVAVTVFNIHEVEADFVSELGCLNVSADESFEIVVANEAGIVGRIDADFFIQERVVIGDEGFELFVVGGFAEASGVGELESDEKDRRSDPRQSGELGSRYQEVSAGIFRRGDNRYRRWRVDGGLARASDWTGEGFAAPDELGAGLAENVPSDEGCVRWVRRSWCSPQPSIAWMHHRLPIVCEPSVKGRPTGGILGAREDGVVRRGD